MDIRKALSEHEAVSKEIVDLKGRLNFIEASMGLVSDTVMGSTPERADYHVIGITGVAASDAAKAAECRGALAARRSRLERLAAVIEGFAAGVDDERIKSIITTRYLDGLDWKATAEKVYAGASASTPRMALRRYLLKLAGPEGHARRAPRRL